MKSKPKRGVPYMMLQSSANGRDLKRQEIAEMKKIMDDVANSAPTRMPEAVKRRMEKVAEAGRRIAKNGLTLQDLDDAYQRGKEDGFKDSADNIIRTCYAGVCLALNELYGFGSKRCCDVLNKLDWHIVYSLTSEDAIKEVWERMKLSIDFKEAFDRITVEE